MFKVCFIGVGSISTRHINNLHTIFVEKQEELVVDVYRSGYGKELDMALKQSIRRCYFKLNDIPEGYDAIFITNPTQYHLHVLQILNNKGRAFFIEKPLASANQIGEIQKLELDIEKVYYVACPLRYTKVMQHIKKNIDLDLVFSVRAVSSSYLPEWRPGIDYKSTYSAKKELGGGVSIDLIHEWDYLRHLFGIPEKIYKVLKKISKLEINCEDFACYIAEYDSKVIELHLDYFGKKAIRELQLITSDDTITCDLIRSKIHHLKTNKTIEFFEDRNEYQLEEMRYFLRLISGEEKNQNTIADAYETLMLTQGMIR